MAEAASGFLRGFLEKFRKEKVKFFDGFIYTQENVDKIREQFKDRKVAIIDSDGVLCKNQDMPEINPDAQPALDELKKAGYSLVLWTSGSRKRIEDIEKKGMDLSQFGLVITAENNDRNESNQAVFADAVTNTPWLNEREKDWTINQIGGGGKIPQVFFRDALWIEDEVIPYVRALDTGKFIYGNKNFSITPEGGVPDLNPIIGSGSGLILVDVRPFGEGDEHLMRVVRESMVFGPELVRRVLEK